MTHTTDAVRRDTDRGLLQSTVIELPSGGSEVVVHEPSNDLALTAFVAVDPDDVVDLSTMR